MNKTYYTGLDVHKDGGFKLEVRESVIEKDLIGSLGVEAFAGSAVEL